MVQGPHDVGSTPPSINQPRTEGTQKKEKFAPEADQPFPGTNMTKEQVDKFWDTLKADMGRTIQNNTKKMHEASEKLKKSLEGND